MAIKLWSENCEVIGRCDAVRGDTDGGDWLQIQLGQQGVYSGARMGSDKVIAG